MGQVPRERFVPDDLAMMAYHDQALPLDHGQTVSQPYMVAAMTEALDPDPTDRVLEVGTGSGYQTAVLALLVAEVYSVERVPALSEAAGRRLDDLGLTNVHLRVGDGCSGWPEAAPFDGIVVTAGAPSVPLPLRDQLSPNGGRLVIPVGDRGLQTLYLYVRVGTELTAERLLECRFVPLVGDRAWDF